MQRLSGADASFVYGETPGSHLHLGTLAVLDPSTAPDGFNVERLRSLIEARAGLLGPFMRRLVEVPFGLDRPAWVDDPRLDLERRIRPVGVPAPGGPRELGALVGDLLAHKVEPDRPLWEVWFIEGLEDGRVALLTKMHHCLADGVRGARIYEVLYDLEPGAATHRPDTPVLEGERVPNGWEMTLRGTTPFGGYPAASRPHVLPPQPLRLEDGRLARLPRNGPGSHFPSRHPVPRSTDPSPDIGGSPTVRSLFPG